MPAIIPRTDAAGYTLTPTESASFVFTLSFAL